MAKFLARLLVTTLAVLISSYLLSGVHVNSTITAVLVALVLALLNTFVKPVLILFTIPITVLTFGLFLLVVNILMIKWTASLVDGFSVDNWWWALLFSLLLSFVTAILEGIFGTKEKP